MHFTHWRGNKVQQLSELWNLTSVDLTLSSAYLLAVLLWASHLASLSFSFLTSKAEDSIIHELHGVVEELH